MDKDGNINLTGNKTVTITIGKDKSEINVFELKEKENSIKLQIGSSLIEMKDKSIEIRSSKVIIDGNEGTITASGNINLSGSPDVIIN